VTVELYEATVPIPVTVRGDQIRVLDSKNGRLRVSRVGGVVRAVSRP
jgi:hypothetical protein